MKSYLKSITNVKGDQGGFTLLETVIAMAIFTVGLLGVFLMQSVSVNNNTLAQTATENTHHAMQTVEDIFAMGWNSNATQPTPGQTELRDGNRYQVDWTISTSPAPGVVTMADDMGQPSVRMITVTSSYVDKGGSRRSVTLSLLKPRM
jgi:prepilin-type N-terminal cleavage/methylation domain-containing protein